MSGLAIAVDVAGGREGGAARWRYEFDAYLASAGLPVQVVGQDRGLTAGWMLRREWLTRTADVKIATNNVSFAVNRGERVVLLRNALHFLYPSEQQALAGMPGSFGPQIPIVRRLCSRADTIVVPCSAMAERVVCHVPGVAERVVVRAHPVTPVGARRVTGMPFVLVPVVPGPYKNLIPQLRALVAAVADVSPALRIRVTASPDDLPSDLSKHPNVEPIGLVPHARLIALWQTATAAFYPSVIESFGYPLAEARSYGVPVIAADTAQSREIAGPALRGYQVESPDMLRTALAWAMHEPVDSEPERFARNSYFDWLLRRPGAAGLPVPATALERTAR